MRGRAAIRGRRIASVVVAATMVLGGCSGEDAVDDQATTVTTLPAGQQTDDSLAALLPRVTINGQPLEPFPVATVREAGNQSVPAVVPQACGFVATGLLNPILDGKPAAMALSTSRINVTMVEMGTVDAAKALVAQRDFVLDSGQCTTVKLTQSDAPTESSISEKEVGNAGTEDTRVIISTSTANGQKGVSAALLGRKGTVLILVNNGARDDVEPLRQVAEHLAKQLP